MRIMQCIHKLQFWLYQRMLVSKVNIILDSSVRWSNACTFCTLLFFLFSFSAYATTPSSPPAKENPLLIRPPQLNYAGLCVTQQAGHYSEKEVAAFLANEKEGRFNGETYLALSYIYARGLGTTFRDSQKADYYADYAAQHPFTGRAEAIAHVARLRLSRAIAGDENAFILLQRGQSELQRINPALAGYSAGELAMMAGKEDAALDAYRSVATQTPRAALALATYYRAHKDKKRAGSMIALAQNTLLSDINQGKCGALLTLADIFLTPDLMTPHADIGMAWLKIAFEAGYTHAGVQLGNYYAEGELVEKDNAQARLWWQQASEQGSKRAMHKLALLYLEEADSATTAHTRKTASETAFSFAEKAATLNYMPSILLMISFYEGKYGEAFYDPSKVMKWEKRALQAPNPPPTLLRKQGLAYRLDTKKDPKESMVLLQKAADAGDINAWQDIADSHRFGWGVAQTPEQSFRYTRKGAMAGSAVSAYQLAEHYHCGIGIKKDQELALIWLKEAITGGNLQAVFTWQAYNPEKGNVFVTGDISSIYAYDRYIGGSDAEKSKTRLQFLENAAKDGSSKALTLLALHARANGLDKKASALIKQAQTTGDNPADSFLVLGTTALERRKDAHARAQAKQYFEKAVRLGSHNAAIALARLNLSEHRLSSEDIKRLDYASRHYVREAALLLGDIYLRAQWYDQKRAVSTLRHAALLGSQSAMLRLATLRDVAWQEKAERAILCDENSLLEAAYYLLAHRQPARAVAYFADAMERGSPKAIRQYTELTLMLHALENAPPPKDVQQHWQLAATLGDKSAQHTLPLFHIMSP